MDDLISRQAVYEMLDGVEIPGNANWYLYYQQALDRLSKLPSAQPERWIPCSEKLPDDLAEVNVTYVNHNPALYYDFTKDKPLTSSAVFFKGRWYWYSSTCADYLGKYGRNDVDKVDDAIEITAWMPLPEPYAERRADDDECHNQF